jgi:acyl-coenzyme A synthetase/AMP-(fatty) acid ligase
MGVLTPVGIEQAVESEAGVEMAAAVGVGPVGTQQLVIVVQHSGAKAGPAPLALVDTVRAVVLHPLAAVLITPKLPVDIRHNSKIDRAAVAEWATRVLSGGR